MKTTANTPLLHEMTVLPSSAPNGSMGCRGETTDTGRREYSDITGCVRGELLGFGLPRPVGTRNRDGVRTETINSEEYDDRSVASDTAFATPVRRGRTTAPTSTSRKAESAVRGRLIRCRHSPWTRPDG